MHTKRAILGLLLIGSWLSAASGGVGAESAQALPPVTDVRTYAGWQTFHVDDLSAAHAAAWRVNADLSDELGALPAPTSGFTLHNRVIVRLAGNDATPLLLLTMAGYALEPVAGAPGFCVLYTPDVAAAIAEASALVEERGVAEAYVDMTEPWALRDLPDDPGFVQQWHLYNTQDVLFDANVVPAWDAGFTGAGVVIGVVEGGWQYDHPDLAPNFLAEATQSGGSVSAHATSVAGVAAAAAFDGLGGVGAAYDAQLSGQIIGSSTEIADALGYRNDLNDIKTNSWGPIDSGTRWYMPTVIRTAIENAVQTGRGGLGEIIVWAAGNGGTSDRLDYDPYASSRFTCAIGSVGNHDTRASYNETGSSMLAVTQSSGNSRYIYTTTSGSGYTSSFGGTSSASPLAAGVIALMLQANPNLTWRDVQHIIVDSARQCDASQHEWVLNGAGHLVNYNYGFGALDAEAAVNLALTWTPVGSEVVVDSGVVSVDVTLPDDDTVGVTQTLEVADNIRIESVELILNAQTAFVGDLRIAMTSPAGTESVFATARSDGNDDYVNYIFTSVRHWDETSAGTWSVHLADEQTGATAVWQDYRLKLYGTEIVLVGDTNCDGSIDAMDIEPFVIALTDPDGYEATYVGCSLASADCNGDGIANLFDIDAFIALLN